jgi:hypothetical protein
VSFSHTDRGISVLHKFFGVDIVVFVEGGGKTHTLEGVANGQGNEFSPDIKFWQELFNEFVPSKKFHFKAVGSKTFLQGIAHKLILKQIEGIVVCMDRDNDHLTEQLRLHSGVIYTYGYSWENDVWTLDVVSCLFHQLHTGCRTRVRVRSALEQEFKRFAANVFWAFHGERIVVSQGGPCLNRTKCDHLIKVHAKAPPSVDLSLLRQLVKEMRSGYRATKSKPSAPEPLLDCYGHLLATFAYNLLVYFLRTHAKIHTLSREVATPLAIGCYVSTLDRNPSRRAYYESRFKKFRA